MANRRRGERRRFTLQDADGHLDALRFLVRLATDFGYLSARQHTFAAERLAEIGRLIGGWRRSEERQGLREGARGEAAGAGRSRAVPATSPAPAVSRRLALGGGKKEPEYRP